MKFCSVHQIRGQVGEGNDTRSGREFQWHNHASGNDTAKELQNHATKTQDTWVGAVENAKVTVIKRTVCRALNQLRAATTKKFDTKGIIQFEHVDHEQVAEKQQAIVKTQKEELNTMMTEGEMCGAVEPWYERSGVDGCADGN